VREIEFRVESVPTGEKSIGSVVAIGDKKANEDKEKWVEKWRVNDFSGH